MSTFENGEVPENNAIVANEVPENKGVGLRGASPIIVEFQDYVEETSGEESTCRGSVTSCMRDSQCCSGNCFNILFIKACM